MYPTCPKLFLSKAETRHMAGVLLPNPARENSPDPDLPLGVLTISDHKASVSYAHNIRRVGCGQDGLSSHHTQGIQKSTLAVNCALSWVSKSQCCLRSESPFTIGSLHGAHGRGVVLQNF